MDMQRKVARRCEPTRCPVCALLTTTTAMERAPQVDLDGLCRAALRGADELERDNVVVARRNRVRPVSAAVTGQGDPAARQSERFFTY